MFESIKTGFLAVLYKMSLPIAKWSGKRLLRLPPPADKEEFRQWALWLCQNRLLVIVNFTPPEIDNKVLSILVSVLETSALYEIVWNKIHGIDPIPDKIRELSFFERVRQKIRAVLHPTQDDDESQEAEDAAMLEAEAGSVVTAIWIFSLILQTPNAIKTLYDLMDFIQNRLGEANGQF
ncbi:MAG: hypothetical protein LBC74_14800 [Planctomycetaceae bacterium]|jgi:hypothetical protein|nr:hypothetical protein [Planctomycetaceae bacterium]